MSDSAAWRVDAWPATDGIGKVVEQFAAIRAILDEEDAFILRDSGISGWSVGEHAGHLAMATGRMAMAIEKCLSDPRSNRDRDARPFLHPILESGDFPRGVANAPPATVPGGRDRTALLEILSRSELRWQSLAPNRDQIEQCASRTEHHRFGFLTARQWLRLCTIHTAHHLRIIEEIRNS